jgi:cell division protein FtsZ
MREYRKIKPRITVIGIGGAGGNAVNNLISAGLADVQFVAANTDMQALAACRATHRIQLGTHLTEGLGAGSHPEIGAAAAEEALDEVISRIFGVHMVFIAAGMGGGTGTGAAPVIARAAKDFDILTVAVVTKPFHFEGSVRMRNAEAGILKLRNHVDTLIVIPNENLLWVVTDTTSIAEAFVMADETLYAGIACIVDLIVKEGLIDLDFADAKTVLRGMGTAMMGLGEAAGEQRAIRAAEGAISNPLIDEVTLKGAKSMLLSIAGGRDLTLWEVDQAANRVRQEVDHDANIIVGTTLDENLGSKMRVSIVASGMPRSVAAPQALREDISSTARESRHASAISREAGQVGWRLREAIMERGKALTIESGNGPERGTPPGDSVKKERSTKRSGEPPAARTRKTSGKKANAPSDTVAQQDTAEKAPNSTGRRRRLARAPAEDCGAVSGIEQLGKSGEVEETSAAAQAWDSMAANQPQAEASPQRRESPVGVGPLRVLQEIGATESEDGKLPVGQADDFAVDEGSAGLTEAPAGAICLQGPESLVAHRRRVEPAQTQTHLLQRLRGLMRSKRQA